MTDEGYKALTMGGNRRMEFVGTGPVQCKRYVGTGFTDLQSKADTGLWYSLIQGNPHAIEGEGPTPEAAVLDSIKRTEERIIQLQNAVVALEACKPFTKGTPATGL